MLPRKQRLTTVEFLNVMEKGRVVHSPLFLFRFTFDSKSDKPSKFAAVAPQKIAKKAVERNSIRRKIYNAVRKIRQNTLSGVVGAIIAKKNLGKTPLPALVDEISSLFVKAGIMK